MLADILFVADSGSLGYDGRGWPWEKPLIHSGLIQPDVFDIIISKTISLNPIEGSNFEMARRVRLIPGGSINAVKLINMGTGKFLDRFGGDLSNSSSSKLMLSIAGDPGQLAQIVKMIENSGISVMGYQYNPSCPNVYYDLPSVLDLSRGIDAIASNTDKLISVKFSVLFKKELVEPFLREFDDKLCFIGGQSVPFEIVFPGKKSPLSKHGGGSVSGKPIQSYTWSYAHQLSKMTAIPVIWPSMWDDEDAEIAISLGAKGVSFASLFMQHPRRPNACINQAKAKLG